MKIYYFGNSPATPSTRYRGKYLLEEVHRRFDARFYFFYPTFFSFLRIFPLVVRLLFHQDEKNIYIIQKVSNQGKYFSLLFFLLKRVKKSIYDIDDAMYLIRSKKVVDYFVIHTRAVLVGSESLLAYCQRLNPNVFLLTTALPCPDRVKWSKNQKFTLGWIGIYGTSEHKENLNHFFFPLLKDLKLPFRFIFLGVKNDAEEHEVREYIENVAPQCELEIIRDINWNDEKEINAWLIRCDVGVMPLMENEINRSKSSFKVKQYIAAGLPTLASDVGDNKIFIKDGETGFLCRTSKDWIQYITFFQKMSDREYHAYAKRCHESFLDSDFNLERSASLFFDFLKRL